MRNSNLKQKRWQQVQKWCAANGIVPQESVIRVAVPLENGKGNYEFNILEQIRRFQNDKTLNRNDLFIPYNMGILLGFEETEANGTPKGKAPLYSFAPKAGVQHEVGFMTDDIEALYNGMLTISMGQTQVNKAFPTLNFKHVPETQPIGIYNGEAFINSGIQPEFDLNRALYDLIPNYLFAGTEDIKVSLQFNATGSNFAVALGSDPTEEDTTHTPFLYFYMTGVLVTNGAEIPNGALFLDK